MRYFLQSLQLHESILTIYLPLLHRFFPYVMCNVGHHLKKIPLTCGKRLRWTEPYIIYIYMYDNAYKKGYFIYMRHNIFAGFSCFFYILHRYFTSFFVIRFFTMDWLNREKQATYCKLKFGKTSDLENAKKIDF